MIHMSPNYFTPVIISILQFSIFKLNWPTLKFLHLYVVVIILTSVYDMFQLIIFNIDGYLFQRVIHSDIS